MFVGVVVGGGGGGFGWLESLTGGNCGPEASVVLRWARGLLVVVVGGQRT